MDSTNRLRQLRASRIHSSRHKETFKKVILIFLTLGIIKLIYDYFPINDDIDLDLSDFHSKLVRDPIWKSADNSNILLDKTNFVYEKIPNSTFCDTTKEYPMLLLILVSSSRLNYASRLTIRETWGSLLKYNRWNIRLVFLLASQYTEEPRVNQEIEKEMKLYDDIIIGNFKENSKMEVYKSLMGYKWALNYCRTADFVMNTQENVYIELFKVIDRLSYFGRSNLVFCYAIWAENVNRDEDDVRFVSEIEYPGNTFPSHCNPTVNIVSFDVVEGIYRESKTSKFLHLADVFLTGILQETLRFPLIDIGFEYQFKTSNVLHWVRNGQYGKDQRLQWMFIVFNKNIQNYFKEYYDLWGKVIIVYSKVLSFEVSNHSKYIVKQLHD